MIIRGKALEYMHGDYRETGKIIYINTDHIICATYDKYKDVTVIHLSDNNEVRMSGPVLDEVKQK